MLEEPFFETVGGRSLPMIIEDVVWGVDIGRSSLKTIRMHKLRDTVEITGLDVIDYFGSSEEQPSSAEIRQALAQFKLRNKVKATDIISVAVPGYAAFTRFIKLPPVDDKKIGDVVKYEAAQQIPFPLSDVIWGYQKVEREYAVGEEIEVGIFAIREEIVNNLLADFNAAKLHVDVLTIAPLALFNFTRFEMDIPDNAIVVDIGADHTDLLVIEGGKFNVRNLPLAGNDITKRLVEEFEITFLEAEKLKMKASQSKQSDKLFAVMQPVLRDFVGEILRSLSFYKSESKQMVLLGNATKLEGLATFFASNLDMKINRFFDIMHMELAHDVDITILQEHLPSFGVAMGLAIQALGKGPHQVNLIPSKLAKVRQIERKQPIFIAAAALLLLLILFSYMSSSGRIETLETTYNKSKKLLDELQDIQKEQEKLEALQGTQSKIVDLVEFARRRNLPIEIINNINRAVPDSQPLIPAPLMGKWPKDLFPPFPDADMDLVNRDKVWLIEFETGEYAEERPEGKPVEGLSIKLTAAVVADQTDTQTDMRLKQIFVDKVAEMFGLNSDDILELPPDKRILSLLPESNLASRPDGSNQTYYKFILKWKVPFQKENAK